MNQIPTGKPSLLGVFDNTSVNDPSKPFRPFSVMTKLFDGKGKYRVGLAIKPPNGELQELGDAEDIELEQQVIYQGAAAVKALDLSKPGLHLIYVTLNGDPVGDPCPIQITHIKPKGSADSE